MRFEANELYHFYNRGNNKQKIFLLPENYHYFMRKVRNELLPYTQIIAWCLMPNHFHFMLMPNEKGCTTMDNGKTAIPPNDKIQMLTKAIGKLQSSYTRAINNQEKRAGSLFQQKSKAKLLTDNSTSSIEAFHISYPFVCFNYIHQNPIRSNLVQKMEDWEHSSFKAYWLGDEKSICNRSIANELLNIPNDPKEFYDMSYDLVEESKVSSIFDE